MMRPTFRLAIPTALLAITLAGCGAQQAEFDPPASAGPDATPVETSEAAETFEPKPTDPSEATNSGDPTAAPLTPDEPPECAGGPGQTVTMLDDVVIPEQVIPAVEAETVTVDGEEIEIPGVPEMVIPERIGEAGCVIEYDAPGGCLGAVEISPAHIPAVTVPERVLPEVRLPDGTVLEGLVLPAVPLEQVDIPGKRVDEVCQLDEDAEPGDYVSSVYRSSIYRESGYQESGYQESLYRETVHVGETRVAGTLVGGFLAAGLQIPGVHIPGERIDGYHLENAEDTEVAEKENQTFYTTESDVLFDVDEATIDPAAEGELEAIAADIATLGDDIQILVEGHTDNVRSAEYNQRLSEERAEAVAAWLVEAGVPEDAITTAGHGFDYPRADNSTEEGRAENRRVVITVTTEG